MSVYQIAAKAIMTRSGGKEVETTIIKRVRGKTQEEACALLSLTYRITKVMGCFLFSLDHQPIDNGINYAERDDGRFVMDVH